MISTIKINAKESFNINNSAGWFLKYRAQFGHDILPDLLPAVESFIKIGMSVVENGKEMNTDNFLEALDGDTIEDALFTLSGLEFSTLFNIAWAMAKNADNSIGSPEDWLNSFETFPVDSIAPAVLGAAVKGCMSSKNAKRLDQMMKSLKGAKTKDQ